MDCHEKIVRIVNSIIDKYPCEMELRFNEPMAIHSSFKTGGQADCWIQPRGDGFPKFTASLFKAAKSEGIHVFILGGGANIVVSDNGIRGIVLDTGAWTGGKVQRRGILQFRSGTSLDEAAKIASDEGLAGLEFLKGMPGSIGGAAYMNARAYGQEISDILIETEVINFSNEPVSVLKLQAKKNEFSYKKSPFQGCGLFILNASFQLTFSDPQKIQEKMASYYKDRQEKGHYRFPSAGSVFKNNPCFGKPTGKIIDELGLKGMKIGGAQVAPFHGNIIINKGGAKAIDIFNLVNKVAAKVRAETGFSLEPEILFIGDF